MSTILRFTKCMIASPPPPEGLQSLVSKNGKATAAVMSTEDLRELFTLQVSVDTHAGLGCPHCMHVWISIHTIGTASI